MTSLRKPKHFVGDRDTITNMGSEKHPIWRFFKEHDNRNVELVRVPDPLSPVTTESAYNKTLLHFKVKDENNNFLNQKNNVTGITSPFSFNNIKNVSSLFVIYFILY